MKIDLEIKRSNNLTVLQGKEGCSRLRPSKLQAGPEEGAGAGAGADGSWGGIVIGK